MIETIVSQEVFDSNDINLEQDNQEIVNAVLEQYPKIFEEMQLQDGTTVAILYNDMHISKEDKDILPPYQYISLSKYGLTQFNASCKRPLGLELTKKAVRLLIELSDGEEIKDLSVSEWHQCSRNRINKGLIPLKKILRTVAITGITVKNGVKDIYGGIFEVTL